MASYLPRECGDYRMGELLGTGTFGKVYKVQRKADPQSGDTKDRQQTVYALKRIEVKKDNKEVEENLVKNEKAMLQAVKHNHVVRFVDSFVHEERGKHFVCIVMEYCDGGTLYHFIRKLDEQMAEDMFVCFLKQIAEGLKYLHGKGILHRDVKTENILLSRNAVLKIGDFGIAKFAPTTAAAHSTLRGTPLYMSPEVVAKKEYGSKTDIWSLGVTSYEMVMGKTAFSGKTEDSIFTAIREHKVPEMRSIDYCPEIVQLMKSMLKKEPDGRPSASEVLQTLQDHDCMGLSEDLAKPVSTHSAPTALTGNMKTRDNEDSGMESVDDVPTISNWNLCSIEESVYVYIFIVLCSEASSQTTTAGKHLHLVLRHSYSRAKDHIDGSLKHIHTLLMHCLGDGKSIHLVSDFSKWSETDNIEEFQKKVQKKVEKKKFKIIQPLVISLHQLAATRKQLEESEKSTSLSDLSASFSYSKTT